jgi:hypothetical protein
MIFSLAKSAEIFKSPRRDTQHLAQPGCLAGGAGAPSTRLRLASSVEPNHFISQGTDFAVADVAWTIEREAGAEPWHFNTTYNLRRTAEGWRVVLCTAYEEKCLNA